MAPIKIFCSMGDTNTIIWKNPATVSTRYCCSSKLIFAIESTDLITKEVNYLRQKIEMLTPSKVSLGNLDITIIPTMILCMIDGKVCNAVSSCSSAQCCYICEAKPTEMNNINILSKKEINNIFP